MTSLPTLTCSEENKIENVSSVEECQAIAFKESKFMAKQMTAVVFSHIAYIRKMFPKKAFVNDKRILGDKYFKVLATNPGCKKAYLLSRYIKSALEALDLEYMKKFGMEIITREGETIEFYFLKYDYKSGGCSLSIGGKNSQNEEIDVKRDISGVLNSLNEACESLGPLPPKHSIKLRIYYNAKETPKEYVPEFFYETEAVHWRKEKKFKRSICGDVRTSHHKIILEFGTKKEQLDEYKRKKAISNQNEPKEIAQNEEFLPEMKCYEPWNIPGSSQDYALYQNLSPSKIKLSRLIDETVHFEKRDLSLIPEELSTDSSLVDIKSPKSSSSDIVPPSPEYNKNYPEMNFSVDLSYRNSSAFELKKFFTKQIILNETNVKCICKLDFKEEDIFLCNHCNNLHHFLCYKLWPGSKDPEISCCFSCANDDPSLICTDPDLIKFKNHVETLAQYRRLMYNMQWRKTITEEIMISKYDISPNIVKNVIALLENEGYVTNSKECYVIQKKKLEEGLKSYFVH